MNPTHLTEGQRNVLGNLVAMRLVAKIQVRNEQIADKNIVILTKMLDAAIRNGDRHAEVTTKILLDQAKECRLEVKFKIIELGKEFVSLAHACDTLPRAAWLRALSVNESEWHTENMQKYGGNVLNVVSVLDLENSATVDDGILFKPLKWCCTMAMMNATKTNPILGKLMHDECNKVFGGALDKVFGEWKEPSILERLGVAN